jgi:hypothetical protein
MDQSTLPDREAIRRNKWSGSGNDKRIGHRRGT